MNIFTRKVVTLAIAGLLGHGAAPASAQISPGSISNAPLPAAGVPKVSFSTNTFDFGRVPAGAVVKVEFGLTNTGTATLEIQDVRPGCGCTTAGTWERKLEPGKGTTLALQLNTASFAGPITKNATVTCNDPTQPTTLLFIRGEVWKPVDVQPNFVVFNLTSDQTNSEVRSVRIVNNTEQEMKIEEPASGHAAFHLAVKPVRPGKEFEVLVTVTPSLLSGPAQIPVSVRTSLTNLPAVSFTAMATVQPALQVMPNEIVLPAGPLNAVTSVAVAVRNNTPEGVTISDASVTVTNVTVSLTPSQPGRYYTISLNFPVGFELKQGQPAELAFKTSNPRIPLMRVPIRMMPAPTPVLVPPAAPQ